MAVGVQVFNLLPTFTQSSSLPINSSLCQQLYQPPILPPEIPVQSLVKRHGMDYRTTFLEERRVRYDGVYISVCHYM